MSADTELVANVLIAAGIGPDRAKRVANLELIQFSPEEMTLRVEQLDTIERRAGSSDICGPVYNLVERIPFWTHALCYSMLVIGTAALIPAQLVASFYLLRLGHAKAIWRELPVPTLQLWTWTTGAFAHVKAPLSMIERSVKEGVALCVNRRGRFKLLKDGYTVMSHVWGETQGWQSTRGFGPVDISLRKKGIAYQHFLRFFDRCNAEWLWIDFIAMPEVLEDMKPEERQRIEHLRTAIINQIRDIYAKADRMVVLETTLLRLSSASPVDVAICIIMGMWIARLWTFTEARLAKRVMLKTKDAEFDLDEIIDFLDRAINNTNHRYFSLFSRISRLREGRTGKRRRVPSAFRPEAQEPHIMLDIFHGAENRWAGDSVDEARALFPLLNMQWNGAWTRKDGFDHIAQAFPAYKDVLTQYCFHRSIVWP